MRTRCLLSAAKAAHSRFRSSTKTLRRWKIFVAAGCSPTASSTSPLTPNRRWTLTLRRNGIGREHSANGDHTGHYLYKRRGSLANARVALFQAMGDWKTFSPALETHMVDGPVGLDHAIGEDELNLEALAN